MMGEDPVKHAETLHADMVKMIPDLAPLKITHCWYGLTGFTHDFIPHIGEIEGIHFSVGYCGVGVPLGSYLGTRLGHKILGSGPELSATPLDSVKFPTEPIPGMRDLYVRLGTAWLNFRDWWDLRSR
jgi:glycine/D-amino acid oxidase-like deaminating enzyme